MFFFVTGKKVISKEDLDRFYENRDSIVQLLTIDEYDVWHDYFYEFLSSAISEYNMSWKSIIVVSMRIKTISILI